jgi:uncharacterized membrane-anchored protein YjiN (DUF445 family)
MSDIEARILPDEAERAAALRRMKAFATAMLALCFGVFLLARAFESHWLPLSFVAAFAEAATIGGLADWYAVVALFRRPLGLPIPHTAIIPSNQERIAQNLGRFIENNFLAEEPVRRRLEEFDFARMVAEWMSDRERSRGLADFVARVAPKALSAVEGSGLKEFASARMKAQLEKIKVAPLAADLLGSVTDEGRHQQVLDAIMSGLGKFLSDEAALAALRERIREELPSLFRIFKADAYLLKRIVNSAAKLLEEVASDPRHPLRAEFDGFVRRFIEELKHSQAYAARAEQLKADLLARPEFRRLADEAWAGVRGFIEEDIASPRSRIKPRLAELFVDIGRQLGADEAIRAEMNRGFVMTLTSFVASQKSGVSGFIADQVRAWDLGQRTRLIEVNVGRDLQYIRFNGMLIGGIAGLLLHSAELLFFGY